MSSLFPVQTVRDRVLATGQLLRALYKRLEERILRTQKKELARTQDLDPEIILPNQLDQLKSPEPEWANQSGLTQLYVPTLEIG